MVLSLSMAVAAGISGLVASPAGAAEDTASSVEMTVPGTGVDLTNVVDDTGSVQVQSSAADAAEPEISVSVAPDGTQVVVTLPEQADSSGSAGGTSANGSGQTDVGDSQDGAPPATNPGLARAAAAPRSDTGNEHAQIGGPARSGSEDAPDSAESPAPQPTTSVPSAPGAAASAAAEGHGHHGAGSDHSGDTGGDQESGD